MTTVVPAEAIRIDGSRTLRFEGEPHGSGISFFFVTNDSGQGPSLHRHPYSDSWHGFTNSGTGPLRMMCIHASGTMIQQNKSPEPETQESR